MEDKEAITILINLSDKYPLSDEEREAISNAIGILSWSSLAESRIKKMKAKRDRDAKDIDN